MKDKTKKAVEPPRRANFLRRLYGVEMIFLYDKGWRGFPPRQRASPFILDRLDLCQNEIQSAGRHFVCLRLALLGGAFSTIKKIQIQKFLLQFLSPFNFAGAKNSRAAPAKLNKWLTLIPNGKQSLIFNPCQLSKK